MVLFSVASSGLEVDAVSTREMSFPASQSYMTFASNPGSWLAIGPLNQSAMIYRLAH